MRVRLNDAANVRDGRVQPLPMRVRLGVHQRRAIRRERAELGEHSADVGRHWDRLLMMRMRKCDAFCVERGVCHSRVWIAAVGAVGGGGSRGASGVNVRRLQPDAFLRPNFFKIRNSRLKRQRGSGISGWDSPFLPRQLALAANLRGVCFDSGHRNQLHTVCAILVCTALTFGTRLVTLILLTPTA